MSSVEIPFGDNASIIGTSVDSSVNRFTGIPFAQPPVGDNRWKQPVKLPADYFQSNSPYVATKFKDLCLQPPSPLPHDPSQHATVLILSSEAEISIPRIACMSMYGLHLGNHLRADGLSLSGFMEDGSSSAIRCSIRICILGN